MARKRTRKKRESLPFGTLVPVGEQPSVEQVLVSIISYNAESYTENVNVNINQLDKEIPADRFNWVNVNGLYNVSAIEKIGKHFSLHNLLLEDVLTTEHIPKYEEYEQHVFITLKMISVNADGKTDYEQIALVLGKNYVISFQEKPGDLFEPLRKRLQDSTTQVRKRESDYLFLRLMDVIVDNYFSVLENLADQLEELEAKTMNESDETNLRDILGVKKDLIYLRKSIYPLRESISKLQKSSSPLLQEKHKKYLADIYDHTLHVIQSIETYRDLVSSLMDLHLSSISYRMNVVMKVLTVMSSIFIPLTFLAGVYGMNFKYIPELEWYYAYPAFWIVCAIMFVVMLIIFRKKKWL